MNDFAWVAPLSTGVAGLVTAAVAWRVATNRTQLLKTALDLRDRIPPELQAEWGFLIHRTASAVVRRSTTSSVPTYLVLFAWVVSIAGVVFERLLLTVVAWLIVIAALVLARVKRRQLERERDEWIRKLQAETQRLRVQGATIAANLREVSSEVNPRINSALRLLYTEGMARPELYRYRLQFQAALSSGAEVPEDPRLTQGMSMAWRVRAKCRKLRRAEYDLPEVPIRFPILERYEADEAKARPEPPASS